MKKLLFLLLLIPQAALACDGTTLGCKYLMWRNDHYPSIVLYEQLVVTFVLGVLVATLVVGLMRAGKKK